MSDNPRSTRFQYVLCAASCAALIVLGGCEQPPTEQAATQPPPAAQPSAVSDIERLHAPDSAAYSADGVLVRFDDVGAGEPAIILIHGWNCDRSYWQLQTEFLAERYRVVAIDLAGHGDSAVDRENWSIQSFAADVSAVVDKLALNDVVLVGHSMGGSVALAASRELTDRVRGIVIVDALRDPDQQMESGRVSAVLDNMEADYSATIAAIVRTMFVDESPARVRDYVIRDMAQSPPAVGKGALLALMAYDPLKDLEGLETPLTLINSDYQPTNTELYARLLPATRIVEMSNVGHFVMLEDPATFTSHLLEAITGFGNQP